MLIKGQNADYDTKKSLFYFAGMAGKHSKKNGGETREKLKEGKKKKDILSLYLKTQFCQIKRQFCAS